MKTESGFSLTELMTALTIGSIVVSFCYATFSFGEMVYSNYVKKTDAADLASRTAQRIASDIRSAKTVIMEPDSAVFIIGSGGKHVGYRFSNGRVTRDSVSFNDNPAVRLEAYVTTKASRYRVLVVVTTGSGVYRAGVETQSLQSSAASFGERGREKEKEAESALGKLIFSGRITLQDKARFCLELSVMLQAGVSLHRALQVLADQADKKAMRQVLLQLVKDVRKGVAFSSAMAAQPKIFDSLFVVSAEIGQESGKLPQVTSNLAVYLEKINVLRRKFLQALTYPFLVLSVAAGVVLFLLLVIVPGFSEMFRSMAAGAGGPMELPAATGFILSVSAALTNYGLYMVLAEALALLLFRSVFMSAKFRSGTMELMYSLPFAGKILTRNMVARFCRTLGTLLQAQVSLVRALEVTVQIMTSEGIRGEVKKIISYVKQGKAVAEPILTSKFFPPMVSQMIAVGEETSELDTMLFKVAEYYEKEVDTAVDSLSNVLEPVLILLIGSVVAVIVVSMYLPMFEMMNMWGEGEEGNDGTRECRRVGMVE